MKQLVNAVAALVFALPLSSVGQSVTAPTDQRTHPILEILIPDDSGIAFVPEGTVLPVGFAAFRIRHGSARIQRSDSRVEPAERTESAPDKRLRMVLQYAPEKEFASRREAFLKALEATDSGTAARFRQSLSGRHALSVFCATPPYSWGEFVFYLSHAVTVFDYLDVTNGSSGAYTVHTAGVTPSYYVDGVLWMGSDGSDSRWTTQAEYFPQASSTQAYSDSEPHLDCIYPSYRGQLSFGIDYTYENNYSEDFSYAFYTFFIHD